MTQVRVEKGQFIFGSRQAAEDLKQSKSSIHRRLVLLEKMGNVGRKVGQHFTMVTICNWDTYQPETNTFGTPSGTASGQHRDQTRIEEKEENKKETPLPPSSRFVKPTIQEIADYAKEKGFDLDAEYFWDYQEARGWVLSNGKKMKDWKATIRTWMKNNNFRKAAGGSSTKAADVKGLEQYKRESDIELAKIRGK